MTPLHFQKFNDKVKAMNSGNGKELKLTAAEARSLHHDLFSVLEELNAMREQQLDSLSDAEGVIHVVVDPGNNSL